jgi:hypothetical protein
MTLPSPRVRWWPGRGLVTSLARASKIALDVNPE